MLSEIPAPFRSEAGSPTPSTLMDVPESPCLSAISSPGGYGSISQVLLPDVTPSPAVHPNAQHYDMPPDAPAGDGASVTMLRLQLAAAENMAKERLSRLQSLEEELHHLKEARVGDVKDLTQQVKYMEEQMRNSLEARERIEDDRAAYTSSLEDQLRHTQAFRDQAVEEAVSRAREDSKVSQRAALKSQRHVLEKTCVAHTAAAGWMSVRDLSTMELNFVAGDRDVLTMLLIELDHMYQSIL
ncbi:hypothetical protein BD779DRAFT_10314 [Infundibulicybe gibba]|nr:hypothetical protein BD779DRAFT_10314 [Infundibulicybe gibba]